MLNYIPLYTGIWSDKNFRHLPDNDNRILFIFLFSNPDVTLTGIYSLDLETCAIKIKTNRDFRTVFNEIITSKMIEWDAENEIIWVVNRYKLLPSKSPKIIAGVFEELNRLEHPFRQKFIDKYRLEIGDYMWRLKESKLRKEELLTNEFLINASKIYSNKRALKNFIMNRGISEERIDLILPKVLPNLK